VACIASLDAAVHELQEVLQAIAEEFAIGAARDRDRQIAELGVAQRRFGPKSHIYPRGDERVRCNDTNRPAKPRISSPLTHSSIAISVHNDT
jgi:hypothetical protein